MGSNTLRIIIPREPDSELPKCIICLSDDPITTIYSGSCTCHPHIHEQCLASWFTENPGVCPICRIKHINEIVARPEFRENTRYYLCVSLFCFLLVK